MCSSDIHIYIDCSNRYQVTGILFWRTGVCLPVPLCKRFFNPVFVFLFFFVFAHAFAVVAVVLCHPPSSPRMSEPERDGGSVPEEQEEERCRQGPPLQGPLPIQLQTLLGARIVKLARIPLLSVVY